MTKKGRSHDPKSRELSEHEARLYRHDIWATAIAKVAPAVVRWTGIVLCAYLAARVAIDWSGETTEADLRLILGGTGWAVIVAALGILFGSGGIAYGKRRERLLRKTVRHFEASKRAREKAIDPDRSSSGLTQSGETPQEED